LRAADKATLAAQAFRESAQVKVDFCFKAEVLHHAPTVFAEQEGRVRFVD
jgi:hypothetical protein